LSEANNDIGLVSEARLRDMGKERLLNTPPEELARWAAGLLVDAKQVHGTYSSEMGGDPEDKDRAVWLAALSAAYSGLAVAIRAIESNTSDA